MKKIAYLMSMCIVFFGVLVFAGCSGSAEIKNIKVTTLPEVTTYTVGQDLMLDGGKFTVEYADGSTRTFDLAYAEPSITKFENAGAITVKMTYQGFSDVFEVRVNQKDFTPNYQQSISTIYNGQAQPATIFNSTQLPNGMSIKSIEYKVLGEEDSTYSSTAPTNAGVYTVRTILEGGNNYLDKTLISQYTIEKANYADFATNDYLAFKGIENITYGADFDLSKQWGVSQTSSATSAIPLSEDLAKNITYSYLKKGDEFATPFTPTADNKIWAQLDAGEYVITVSGKSTENFKAFTQSCSLTVLAKQLEYGVDYKINITDGTTSYDYVAPINSNIQTVIETEDPSSIVVSIEFLGDASRYCSIESITYITGSGTDITNEISGYGNYRILANMSCPTGNYMLLPETYNAITIASIN